MRISTPLFFMPVLCLLLSCAQEQSQDPESIPASEARVDELLRMARREYDTDAEKSFAWSSAAVEMAEQLGYLRGLRYARTFKAYYYYVRGNFPAALALYRASEEVAIPPDTLLAYNHVMRANLFRAMAEYDSAALYYQRTLTLLDDLGQEAYRAFCYRNMGKLYSDQGRWKEAEEAFNAAIEIYSRKRRAYGMAEASFSLSELYLDQSKLVEAEEALEAACETAASMDDDWLRLNCFIGRAELNYRLGHYAKALRGNIEALGILKGKDLPINVAKVYTNIGNIYRGLGEPTISNRYFNEALAIARRVGLPMECARILGFKGSLMVELGKADEGRVLLDSSLAIRKKINDREGISFCYNALGIYHTAQAEYEEAVAYLTQALAIRRDLGLQNTIASSLYNLSVVLMARGDMADAEALQKEAIAIQESLGNRYELGFSFNRLASLYLKRGKTGEAARYLARAESIAATIGSTTLLMENERMLAGLYEHQGNAAKAYAHFKRYAAQRDSLYRNINSQKLGELQALFVMEQKNYEIASLQQERQLQEGEIALARARINQQNIVIGGTVAMIALLSVLALMTFRYNRRIRRANREITEQKEEIQAQSEELMDANQTIAEINRKLEEKVEQRTDALREAYKELDTFFYRSSHDFRRPLTTFMGLAEVAKVTVRDPNALELFEKVRETAANLDKMLVKLQAVSDVGSQQLVCKEVMIKELFETVCDSFRDEIYRRNVKISSDVRLKEPFLSYPALIKIVLENLVENALDFSSTQGPTISLSAVQQGDYVVIDIQDNGQGIAPEYHGQIFDMYFRANERSKGNGLGLYLVKKAVEKLGGSVTVSSIVQVGTTFTIMLPMLTTPERGVAH